MTYPRFCFTLLTALIISTSASAKIETLAERGKRMCEEAGVPLEDCAILPPGLRSPSPDATVAATTLEPIKELGPGPAAFGTGKYGWCEDCTSLLAAAPVTPWSEFSGVRRNRSPREEDDRSTVASVDSSSPGGSPGNGDQGDDSDTGDQSDGTDGSDGGTDGDDSGSSGEVCD